MAEVPYPGLADWLPRQRWFGSKSAQIKVVRVLDRAPLDPVPAAIELMEVDLEGQSAELYQLVRRRLGGALSASGRHSLASEACPPSDRRERPEKKVASHSRDCIWDVLGDESVRGRLYDFLAARARIPGGRGTFEFEPFEALPPLAASRPLGAEQSNTSLLYSAAPDQPKCILKLFRRLQAGENPEAEVPRALARFTHFARVPRALGEIRYMPADGGQTIILAALQAFVPNQGDGWSWVLRRLREQPAVGFAGWDEPLRRLGARTAELHRALASISIPAFAPEPVTAADVAYWRDRARAGLEPMLPSEYARLLAPWRAELEAGAAGADAALGTAKIRIHGDYHLGQVLCAKALHTDHDDFVLFDFEGEPARSIAARRRKGSALQDVAGMLRSFSYAAHTANRLEWEAPARAAFLAGYGTPPPPLAPLLRFFEIEKAVYELRYELDHRPEWVRVPLAGLTRLLHSQPA